MEMKEKILEERPDTTVEALQIARRVAALWTATRKTEGHATFQGRRSWQQHSYGGASATQPGRSQGQQSATTSTTPTAKQPSAGSASKPKKFEGNCHHRGKAGHKKSECWSLNGGKPKKQTSAALPVADMDSDAKEVVTRGMLTMQLTVVDPFAEKDSGIQLTAVVDTGSTVSLLTEEALNKMLQAKLGYRETTVPEKEGLSLRGISKEAVTTVKKVTICMNITQGSELTQHTFWIVRHHRLPGAVQVLLGLDLLKKRKATIDMGSATITFPKQEKTVELGHPGGHVSCRSPRLTREFRVRALLFKQKLNSFYLLFPEQASTQTNKHRVCKTCKISYY
jgi:hypothetical protein